MSGIERTAARARVATALVVACATLFALLAAGCSGGGTAGGSSADQKAMREVIGKYYAAQGNLDLKGMRASLYDPQNIAGLATATVPAEAQKTEVNWKSVGDTVVITVPSQEVTITVATAKSPANSVTVTSPQGPAGTFIMKKDNGVWKIDVAETEKAMAAESSQPGTQSAPPGQTAP